MKLFLDSCIIIYWVEMSEPYYSHFITALKDLNTQFPNATLVTSQLSLLECFVKPLRQKNNTALKLYREFFDNPNVELVELNKNVIEIATALRVKHALKVPDALQAACAMALREEVVMVTNDRAFSAIQNLNVKCI